MSDRFVVEADRRIVGVAVRAQGGYRFFSSEPAFFEFEGKTFARARQLLQAITKFARKVRKPGARIAAQAGRGGRT